MIEFPFVWLVSVLAIIAATTLAQSHAVPFKARILLCVFLLALASLAGLVGARLAGWADWAFLLQPSIAIVIGPAGYLGFRALTRQGVPETRHLLLLGGLPIVCLQIAFLVRAPLPIDWIILVINICCAVGLGLLLRLDEDEFPFTPPHEMFKLRAALIAVILLFILMITADLLIALAIMMNKGAPSLRFVSGASGFLTAFILIAVLIGLPLMMRSGEKKATHAIPAPSPSADEVDMLETLNAMMRDQQLYRDQSLTLARLARRVGVPSRDISNAINKGTGENFSRFVNAFRVEHAKVMLTETQLPVTEVMLEAGFVSKSSFNTEFRRIVGLTPTQFRNKP